jgi:hypothetical protein
MKKVVILVCLVLAAGAWYRFWYKPHSVEHSMIDGDTSSPDGSAPASDESASQAQAAQEARKVQTAISAGSSSGATSAGSSPSSENTSTGSSAAGALKAPAGDTISPNPPNGMIFAGTGHFQVYRQGNITWRVNTDSGQACILFATDSEWRKPRVYEHGCPNS